MKNYKDRYQRKHSVTLCFNDDEIKKVDNITEALKKPRATAIRDIILSKEGKINRNINRNINSDLVYQLNKIGVNINQISRAINTDIDRFMSHDLAEDFLIIFQEIVNDLEIIKSNI